ncbi:unnamed protein product [Alternaria alternata]
MRFTNDLPVDRTTNAYDAWPFVELVSIGGPFAVLERNIIQADTPGQDDIDLIAETSEIEDPSSIDKNEFEQTEEVRRLDAELLFYAASFRHIPLTQLKKRLIQFLKAQMLVDQRDQQNSNKILSRTISPKDVFCVSTHDYQRKVSGYAVDGFALFPLTPERAQIPALKKSNVRPWNMQLLAPIKKGLDPIFDTTMNNLQNDFEQVEREISSAMKLLELNLRAQCPDPITVELDTFIRRITHRPIELRDMENAYINDITALCKNRTTAATVKLAQMEMFEQLLCDANTNPFKAVYTRLGEAIVSEKQRVKDLLEEHVGALFRSIEEEFEWSREVGVALTNEEAQIMDDLLNSRVTAAKVRGILEEKLKECGVDVEAIKAEFTERQSL